MKSKRGIVCRGGESKAVLRHRVILRKILLEEDRRELFEEAAEKEQVETVTQLSEAATRREMRE